MPSERNKKPNKRGTPAGVHRVQAESREHEIEALKLRRAGANYREIASAMGCSVSSAHDMVGRALKRLRDESAEQARDVLDLELQRLDRMLVNVWPQVEDGNLMAVRRALQISERRMKMLGLEAEKLEHSGPGGGPITVADAGYQELVAKLDKYREDLTRG